MDPAAATPDRALVLEVIGPVADFARAARDSGFEWLAEDYANDGDADGGSEDPVNPDRLYLTMPTVAGFERLLAFWRSYRTGGLPESPTAKTWWALFGYLADVRTWSAKDRVDPSLAAYVEARAGRSAEVRIEFDLWFRATRKDRDAALAALTETLGAVGGDLLDAVQIEGIRHHGVLANVPAAVARQLARGEGALAIEDAVMTVRPQSAYRGNDPLEPADVVVDRSPPGRPDARPALAALLDGYPVQGHQLLSNRVDIEEIDVTGAQAPVATREHGTAMASLIIHGDLAHGEQPLDRVLKVVPILAAGQGGNVETTPSDKLPLAMIYRAVEALQRDGDDAPVIFNHSVCDLAAPFVRRPSAWAKLLDYLSFKHDILFVVSAGNIDAPFALGAYPDASAMGVADPIERGLAILRALEASKGVRGILSPAEAVNVVTVGALHEDGAGPCPPPNVDPFEYAVTNLGSPAGLGVNRGVKPEVVHPGGRQVASPVAGSGPFAVRARSISHLGQLAAAPDAYGGSTRHLLRSTGTSNAAALVTRSAVLLAEALSEVVEESGETWTSLSTRAAMLKALLIHGCGWGQVEAVLDRAYPPAGTKLWRRRRQTITRFVGFGRLDRSRVIEGDARRVTLLGDDEIRPDSLHEYRVPIPAALLGSREVRRITLTLAWNTPVMPTTAYRGVALDVVDAAGGREFWRSVKSVAQPHPDDSRRGTVIHIVLEGRSKIGSIPTGGLFVGVQARALHPDFANVSIPYGLAVSIEVGQSVRADVHAEVSARVRSQARVRTRTGTG